MRILIAEDDLDIATLYKKALEKNKNRVVITSNGKDCLMNYITTLKNMRSSTLQLRKTEASTKSTHSFLNSTA
jgi:DNA-binding response OmpR family regulator